MRACVARLQLRPKRSTGARWPVCGISLLLAALGHAYDARMRGGLAPARGSVYLFGIVMVAAAVLLPALVRASGGEALSLTPNPLVLDPGGAATTWSGAIRLQSEKKLAVSLLPRALRRLSPNPEATHRASASSPPFGFECKAVDACVDGAAVKVDPATLTLEPNVPAEVVVTVTGPLPQGVYEDAVDVTYVDVVAASPVASDPVTGNQVLTVRVVARASPSLAFPFGSESVTARRVRIDNALDETLARFLLTEAERSDELVLPAVNDSSRSVSVSLAFDAIGQSRGHAFPSGAITWTADMTSGGGCPGSSTVTLAPGTGPAIKACLDKDKIEADRYLGALALVGEAGTKAQAIPVDLTVKEGPSGPFLWILLGILLGSLAKVLIDHAFPAAELFEQLRKLDRRIDAMPAVDQVPLLQLAHRVRDCINVDDEGRATIELATLSKAVEVTESLRAFECTHGAAAGDERAKIRRLLRDGLFEEAETALRAVRVAAAEAAPTTADRSAPPAAAEEGVEAAGAGARLASVVRHIRANRYWWVVVAIVAFAVVADALLPISIAGGLVAAAVVGVLLFVRRREIRSYVVHNWIRGVAPLRMVARILIGLGLALVGLETLYVANGAQLIATPLDPIVVFLFWGLGSDAASRTLINFAKPG